MRDRRALFVLFSFIALIGGMLFYTQNHKTTDDPSASQKSDASSPHADSTTSTWQLEQKGDESYIKGNVEVGPTRISETDWRAGLADVTKRENDAFLNPNPTTVDSFMLKSCACYKETVDRLNALQVKKHRVAGANIEIADASLIKEPNAQQVDLLVSIEAKGFNTVDANGNTIETGPAGITPPFRYILEKGSDNQWRIADRRAS